MSYPYTITNESISVIIGGKSYVLRKEDKNFLLARSAILTEKWDDVPALVSSTFLLDKWIGGNFKVVEGRICYKGEAIETSLNERMIKMAEEGVNPSSWLKFWELLQLNPSYRSVKQLYSFLVHGGIPINEEGHVLAYKAVTQEYKDQWTKTIDNSPGAVNEMPRNQISDDPNVPCHAGFHVGELSYALNYGHDKRIIICAINPADVVCVPYDFECKKMRVCKYKVIGNYSGEALPSTVLDERAVHLNRTSLRGEAPLTMCGGREEGERSVPELDQVTCSDCLSIVQRLQTVTLEESTVSQNPWALYHQMSKEALLKESFDILRTYARQGCQMVGVSRMKGTKLDLVNRILEIRSK